MSRENKKKPSSSELYDSSDFPTTEKLEPIGREKMTTPIESRVEACNEPFPDFQVSLNESEMRDAPFHLAVVMSGDPVVTAVQQTPEIAGFEFDNVRREGGQGVVFRAKELELGRYVAIKMLKPGFYGDYQQSSLLKEARAVAKLDHPRIVQLHSLQWSEIGPFLVMDWVDGGTLLDLLVHRLPTIEESVSLMIDLAGATQHAHENRILHRDIKPSNIMLSEEGFKGAKLTDFGLAKLGQQEGWSTADDMVGTPSYMAPELFLEEPGKAGPAVDIYSLGAVLYRILTGRVPFEGGSPIELSMKINLHDVTPPREILSAIPKDLETICLKCLRREPNERYNTALALKEDLIRFQQGRPIQASRETNTERWRRWARRDPVAARQLAGFIGFLVVIIILLGLLLDRVAQNKRIAEERLSKTVEAMRITSPIFKRFLKELPANKSEMTNIIQYARMRESISAEPENLKERLQFHYVTLELADAISHIDGYEKESLDLNVKARYKIGAFLQKYRDEAKEIVVYESVPDHFRFTLLEKAEIQYGHACSQLYTLITKRIAAKDLNEESVGYLREAIEHARNALRLNPDLDEAQINLANYLAAYSFLQKNTGDYEGAVIPLQTAVNLNRRLTEIEPAQKDRWEIMIEHERQLVEYYMTLTNETEKCYSIIKTIKGHLTDPLLLKVPDRGSVEMKVLVALALESRVHYQEGKKEKAVEVMESLIDRLTSLSLKPINTREYEREITDLQIDLLQLYYLCGKERAFLKEKQEQMKQSFELITNDSIREVALSKIFLFSPLLDSRQYSQARQMLANVSLNESNSLILKDILDILECDKEKAVKSIQKMRVTIINNVIDAPSMLKLFAAVESLVRLGCDDLARDSLESMNSSFDKLKLYPLTIQAWKICLEQRLNITSQVVSDK